MTHTNTTAEEAGIQMGTKRALIRTIVTSVGLALIVMPTFASAYAMNTFKRTAPTIADSAHQKYGDMISIASLLQDYDEKMILSVIVVESEGNKNALSNRGAQGLMQLMPGTAKEMGAKDPTEPFQNILAGTKYLKLLEERYGFDHKEALVAYNMGPTRAKRWLSQYSPDESLYVQKVMHVYTVLNEKESLIARATEDRMTDATGITSTRMLTKPKALSMNIAPDTTLAGRRLDVVEDQ